MAEHQRIALWTPVEAQRFSGPFPRLCRTCSVSVHLAERDGYDEWLPSMDSHHDDRLNRPTGSFTSPGKLKWRPHQDSNLEPQPLEAANALFRYTLRACLGNWSGTPVMLRVSLGPKPSGFLSSSCPMKLAVATGAAPAVSCLTSKRVCCFSSRPEVLGSGMCHPPLEPTARRRSTEMVRRHGVAPCRSGTPALQTGSRL